MKVLYFINKLEPFKIDSVLCNPIPYLDGYILPLGWEKYLTDYEIIEYVNNDNINL
tara:strand:+ start:5901 stop:6068 length:168 start_codon:yes stop_codon:yes gene_type:complete